MSESGLLDNGDPISRGDLERVIEEKGKTAPRITKKRIDDVIEASDVQYYIFPNTTVTVCCIKLPYGYCLVGHSACADPDNFDVKIGRKLAHDRAAGQLWSLEGYRLVCDIAREVIDG
jgi:hypothetical protein